MCRSVPCCLWWTSRRGGSQETLDAQQAALTTSSFGGCLFTLSSAVIPVELPPRHAITLTRNASGTCPYPAARVELGRSYNTPHIAALGTSVGLTTAFSYKQSPSGSANTQCKVNHIDAATLTKLRDTNIVVNFGAGNVPVCNLDQTDAGTTLVVYGTKTGPLPGETGSGGNYVATDYNVFTSTTAPVYYAY
ncbi:hypothetical protein [Myxococcus llanfairpwllgwyngyllgogerychwyrndrobwllllantysiliogogogochensis]|uniref:hypothetical protein n=1 Tax=Myxococcus llanfairpwllgwyngyllgogerychwyrndrobwllllantysiliogogogochensis TaxID=2590453 RepID=UPI001FE79174|nr:hypothetical protein [Myxococcus llanfairpwllgwyngyllgogerychwyrndrobwllllantysiliogogogochensis]